MELERGAAQGRIMEKQVRGTKHCLVAIGAVLALAAFAQTDIQVYSLNSPDCVKAPEATSEMSGDEVLGVERNKEWCAYPLRMMAYHKVVNDHLGGPAIVVAYDPDTAIGQVFDPKVEGKEYQFDAAGHQNGYPVLRDRQTKSLWSQLTGACISGPLTGKKMAKISSWIISWGAWKGLYPASWVLKEDTKLGAHYVSRNTPAKFTVPANILATVAVAQERRLPADTLVLGVSMEKGAKAYPYSVLNGGSGAVHDKIGGNPLVVFSMPAAKVAAAYAPASDGKKLTFTVQEVSGARVWVDDQTGSVWNIAGKAIDGSLKGNVLPPLDFVRSRWYAWASAYPKSAIRKPAK